MSLYTADFFTCRDYRPIPALDVYDPTALDDEDYDELDPEARQEAERQMRKRDREDAAARGRLHRGLLYGILCCFLCLLNIFNWIIFFLTTNCLK